MREVKLHHTLCVSVYLCGRGAVGVCGGVCEQMHEADVMLDLAGWTTTFSNSCLS